MLTEDQISQYMLEQEEVGQQLQRITDKIMTNLYLSYDVSEIHVKKLKTIRALLDNLEKAIYAQITAQE